MSVSLAPLEREAVEGLVLAGMSYLTATVAVAMVTRIRARPKEELVDILTQFAGLEDPDEVEAAVDGLIELGWLVNSQAIGGQVRVEGVADLRGKIAAKADVSELATKLVWAVAGLLKRVRVLGAMTDEEAVYDSYIALVREARTEICIYMMTQSPRQDLVRLFQDRARHGVHVRILLAAPDVAVGFWGEPARAQSDSAIRGWRENARGIPRMEIRVSHSKSAMEMATSVGFDGKIARVCVFDPRLQRSREGVMIEAESPEGFELNLVRAFHRLFELAWAQAHPADAMVSAWRHAWWHTVHQWRLWSSGMLYLLSVAFAGYSLVSTILFAVATTLLVEAIVLARDRLGVVFRLWRR